jgi:hypothetical protein
MKIPRPFLGAKVPIKFLTILLALLVTVWGTLSSSGLSPERIFWLKEIQNQLNASFQCEYSISVGKTRKLATSTSGGLILVDREFLKIADKDRLFFALAHEYAHAYLQHDVRIFDTVPEGKEDKSNGHSRTFVETRRQCEKEADGIAARKAKQLGFDINNILDFILTMPDSEKGIPAESRVYSSPRDRAQYVLAVYQSS